MQAPIRWHAEARRMRAQGHGVREIPALVGKSHSAVKWLFKGEPATTRKPSPLPGAPADKAAKPARRPSPQSPLPSKELSPTPPALSASARLVDPHTPRVPRVTLDRAVLQAAALAFARGEIDRAELMRRISR